MSPNTVKHAVTHEVDRTPPAEITPLSSEQSVSQQEVQLGMDVADEELREAAALENPY